MDSSPSSPSPSTSPELGIDTIRVGLETPLGVIEQVSLTACLIEGTWVPFGRLFDLPEVEPLVTLW